MLLEITIYENTISSTCEMKKSITQWRKEHIVGINILVSKWSIIILWKLIWMFLNCVAFGILCILKHTHMYYESFYSVKRRNLLILIAKFCTNLKWMQNLRGWTHRELSSSLKQPCPHIRGKPWSGCWAGSCR